MGGGESAGSPSELDPFFRFPAFEDGVEETADKSVAAADTVKNVDLTGFNNRPFAVDIGDGAPKVWAARSFTDSFIVNFCHGWYVALAMHPSNYQHYQFIVKPDYRSNVRFISDASQMLVAQCVYVLGAGLVCLVANVAILGGSSLRISR